MFENWSEIKIIWKKTRVLKFIWKWEFWKLKFWKNYLKIKFENWNFEELFENWSFENYLRIIVLKIGILKMEVLLNLKIGKLFENEIFEN